jgi:hypothetical protein
MQRVIAAPPRIVVMQGECRELSPPCEYEAKGSQLEALAFASPDNLSSTCRIAIWTYHLIKITT